MHVKKHSLKCPWKVTVQYQNDLELRTTNYKHPQISQYFTN